MNLSAFKQQFNLFLLNLGFFTRIPVLAWAKYSDEAMAQSRRYLALTGALLALILACFYYFLTPFLPAPMLVVLLMVLSILLTGAFHEDGLADVADAFGGGMDKARKLEIMKDSRLGTYGTSALVMVLLAKYSALVQLAAQNQLIMALFVAYPVSRAVAISHVADLSYVAISEVSKSGPVANKMRFIDWAVLFGTAGMSLLLLSFSQVMLLVLICVALRIYLKRFMHRHIGGFTGDTLGAAQQLQEIAIYTVLLVRF